MTRSPQCYLVNDRPVMIVGTPDGGADCLVLDWISGSFVPDRSYFSRTIPGYFGDVDVVTIDEMTAIVARHRAVILQRLAERLATTSDISQPRTDSTADTTRASTGAPVDVMQLLGLSNGTPPFDGDDAEPTIGPGLLVVSPKLLRRRHLDAVLGPPRLGAGPADTLAASYHVAHPHDGSVGCTILAVFPSDTSEADAVLVQVARRAD